MNIRGLGFANACLTVVIFSSWPSINLAAKEIAIYRWVDSDDVVHFSQNLPKTNNYSQLSTVSSFKALSKEERQEMASQQDLEQHADDLQQQKTAENAQNKAIFEKNCKAAQLNIAMLNSHDDVLIIEEGSNGMKTERVLSDKEKTEKLALSEKHIDLYCKQ